MEQAGFAGAELVGETGFNSSAITKGVLMRAHRPGVEELEAQDRALVREEFEQASFFSTAPVSPFT